MHSHNRSAIRTRSRLSVIALTASSMVAVAVAQPELQASAAPDGEAVVINEVYGGGGNTGAAYANDFVELYNPTQAPIDVTGWVLEQRSARDGLGGTTQLSGVVPAGGYFLIQGGAGANAAQPLPAPDAVAGINFGAREAIAVLTNAEGVTIDLVGWGGAQRAEAAPALATTNATSVQRVEPGQDTDNNAADFMTAAPSPQNSGGQPAPQPGEQDEPDQPEQPGQPDEPEQPAPEAPGITSIAHIQGTGDTSPLEGQRVTTEGVVTAVYDEGGKNGFFIQTAGSGGVKNPGDASDGLFIYMGSKTNYPRRGESVRVTGKVSEYYSQTQVSAGEVSLLDTPLAPPRATELEVLPAGGAAREPYEGMLVRPGTYTVTDNYSLNTTGDLGLAPGTRAHRTPTDVVAPGADANALQQQQESEVVYLDDGRTRNYFQTDKATPLPYLLTADQGVKSIRTGDVVAFHTDVVVDYSFDQWRFQPLEPITGKNAAEELPITWQDSRALFYDVPDTVAGDYSIGFFNVLNYFTSLGKDEAGCGGYPDMYGNPVGANRCRVRGAFSQEAFQDQQAKIVTAISKLDADVLGLSEIENTYRVAGDVSKRDDALAYLVGALNERAGVRKWAYVPSPAAIGTDEDVIRVGFIYNTEKVRPVGESRIFDDPAFTRTARQPLAQEFAPVAGGPNFVAVVNHFKSKGSVANGDEDMGDGQGNNANIRAAQSQALLNVLTRQEDWAGLPTFLIGDFNAYTQEDAVKVLEAGGFSHADQVVENPRDFDQASYQFGGQLGTLDHILANDAALALVQDSAVWNINADESVAFEYSRRNYNAHDFFGAGDDPLYGYGNPFRASDHDPVKVGFNAAPKPDPHTPDAPAPNPDGAEGAESPGSSGSSGSSMLTRVGDFISNVVTQVLGSISPLLKIENRFQ